MGAGGREQLWSQFSPSFIWVPGIELMLLGLCGKHLYPLSYLTGSGSKVSSLKSKEAGQTDRVRVGRYQDVGMSALLSLRDLGTHGCLQSRTEANSSGRYS